MTLQEPASMDECMYFTNRTIDSGKATAWVFKKECPKCKEGRLGKPIKKNGKPDKKSENYECPKCKYNESNEETEKDLTVNIKYTCPHCGKEGEATTVTFINTESMEEVVEFPLSKDETFLGLSVWKEGDD